MSNQNLNLEVILQLQNAKNELNPDRVAWIFKWQIIDLRDKASVLLESVSRFENGDNKEAAITAAKMFLTQIKSVIHELNKQK